jgi:hypothetical protein
MNIGVIGCGKRFTQVYWPILQKLGHRVFLWNRTKDKSEKFCKSYDVIHVEDLQEMNSKNLDLVLCFVPTANQHEVLQPFRNANCKILVETPAEDQRLLQWDNKIGALEQWPKLPLEQFKSLIYSTKKISKPYMVFNDGRSYDYHAIAQLRTYLNYPLPDNAKGSIKNYQNSGVIGNGGILNKTPHEWTLGQIEMNDGSVLLHNFSYNCKSLLSIPVQFLRAYSMDGCIVTGRMKQLNNDYEFIDVRYVEPHTKDVIICNVKIERSSENSLLSIACEELDINWKNPYSHLNFDDQQIAIATLIDEGTVGKIYSYYNAFVDNICMNMIKRAGYNQQIVKLS